MMPFFRTKTGTRPVHQHLTGT